MRPENLLELIGEAKESYILSAMDSRKRRPERSRYLSVKRTILIAAIISLLLLLVGCVAGFLRLQDMSIGQEMHTERFDERGKMIEPTEVPVDMITFFGHSGDSVQLAMKDWYRFLESYDTDRQLMTNEADRPDIPDRYEHVYGCYSAEMVAQMDAISEEYALKLLEDELLIQTYQSDIFMEALGLGDLLVPDADAEIKHISAIYYPPYNFRLDLELDAVSLQEGINASLTYTRKDYFPAGLPGRIGLSGFEQWDHTAQNGMDVLLALSDKGVAYIIHEQKDAIVVVSIDGNFSDSQYPDKEDILTREQLEGIANLFDYSMEPQDTDLELLKEKLDAEERIYQEANTYVPEKYADYIDYLKKSVRHENDAVLYAFYDLTGDGKEELLIGQDGGYTSWISIENGQAQACDENLTYLCEGGVREEVAFRSDSKYEKRCYYSPVSDTAVLDRDSRGALITVLTYTDGIWYQGKDIVIFTAEPVSKEHAGTVMARYPRIQLQWRPLLTYPLNEDGLTLGEYVKQFRSELSEEELRHIYAEFIESGSEDWCTHYRIADINEDGVDDLLLSGDGEGFWCAYTYHYGNIVMLCGSEFYLCEGNVIEHSGIDHLGIGMELEVHKYVRYSGYDCESIAFVGFNKATGNWQSDRDGTVISASDADMIMAKYPRTDQGMRLISELIDR